MVGFAMREKPVRKQQRLRMLQVSGSRHRYAEILSGLPGEGLQQRAESSAKSSCVRPRRVSRWASSSTIESCVGSDWSRRVRTNRATPAQRLDEASSSMKKSYITEPGFHLPSVFDVAYGECRYTTGTP